MRKLVMSALVLILAAGVALASPVVLLSFDGKQIKIQDGDRENTYKISEKTTYVLATSGGEKEIPKDIAVKFLTDDKSKGKKIEVVVEGDTVSKVKMPGRKPKP